MREAAAAQAVALQDAKMEALVLSKKLRRLEAGGSHASLFEVYEEELAASQAEAARQRVVVGELESAVRDLRLEIETLRAVAAEAGDPALRVAGSEGLASGAVDVLAEGRAAKVRSWKRALAIADKERAVLRAELAGLQKRIRHADFHRRAAEDSSRKLLKASREAERLTAELRDARLAQSQAQAALLPAEREREVLRDTCRQLEEQLQLAQAAKRELQFERRRDELRLRHPRLSEASRSSPRGRGGGGAAARRGSTCELLRLLEAELGTTGVRVLPRVHVLLQRAQREAGAEEEARREAMAREEELMQILVDEQLTRGGGGAGAAPAAPAARPSIKA
uniref:Uncharacterized protein n=2 Tax=Emiliania huxleyi TaxID=2903 RepID=A0A7S3W6K5_EMIHU